MNVCIYRRAGVMGALYIYVCKYVCMYYVRCALRHLSVEPIVAGHLSSLALGTITSFLLRLLFLGTVQLAGSCRRPRCSRTALFIVPWISQAPVLRSAPILGRRLIRDGPFVAANPTLALGMAWLVFPNGAPHTGTHTSLITMGSLDCRFTTYSSWNGWERRN